MYTIREMVRIAKLYYELGMTQQEIAEKENISRPTVSRILDAAIKQGIVKITIDYPLESVKNLEDELMGQFGLKKVFVTPVYVKENALILGDVGKALSSYLQEIIKDGDVLGISWGNTLTYVAAHLQPMNKKDVKVVQLNGGVSTTSFSTGAMSILEKFAKAIPAQPYMLSVPAIVDSSEIAFAIMQDSSIKEILSLGKRANIAVFGIGKSSYESVLFTAGYFSNDSYRELLNKGAVGDICSRFFNIHGEICDHELNKRTIGIQLEDLIEKEYAIAIACGEDKAPAIRGALCGKYINALFTDEHTAKAILDLHEKLKKG